MQQKCPRGHWHMLHSSFEMHFFSLCRTVFSLSMKFFCSDHITSKGIMRCARSPAHHSQPRVFIAPIALAFSLRSCHTPCRRGAFMILSLRTEHSGPSRVSFKLPLLFSFKLMPGGKHMPSLLQACPSPCNPTASLGQAPGI
jgi:hypothetical protein